MNPTHRDRQDTYRFWHPQPNITFPSRLEYRAVHRTLHETGQTPPPNPGAMDSAGYLPFRIELYPKTAQP